MQQGARAIAVDEPAESRRDKGETGYIAGSGRPAARKRAGRCLHEQQDRQPGHADGQPAEDGGAKSYRNSRGCEQRRR